MADPLAIERVDKIYHGGNQALHDVSIAVEPGRFLVLLGPSGSGKTTLLRCLAGIERITSGRVRIGGLVVADGAIHIPPERRDLSMVFQDYALWPHLSARDNVAFSLKRRGLAKAAAREVANRMLERVGLAALADRYPTELSGGEQQRVALARALVGDTGLLLCDEPLSNLDADLRERMRIEISALVRDAETTTVYITHDQGEAFALADEIGVLEKGRLVQLGAPETIYTRPASPFVARFTGLAAEIPVRLCAERSDRHGCVEVAVELGCALGRISARAAGPLPAADATLLVRPTAVRLTAPHHDEAQLVGHVRDVAYRGRGYEHVVTLAEDIQVTGVFAEHRHARGTRVGLWLDAGGCHVFARRSCGQATPGGDDDVSSDAADERSAASLATAP